ncbi:MAG TPA: PilT/PilU family type 4a pilus ATPase [Coriobacteriia bacterium]
MAQLKVLIVDDDLALYERIQASFAAKAPDVIVLSAMSGARAAAIATSQHPDVILVDADIPDDDGYLLCAKLRDNHELLDAQIVMLVAVADETASVRARDAGAAGVLAASAEPSEILATVKRVSAKPPASSTQSAAPAGAAEPVDPRLTVGSRPKPPGSRADDLNVDDLLRTLLDREGSDLHLTAGSPPGLRIRGEIHPLENCEPLTPKDTQDLILTLLSEEQRRRFDAELELDFAYSIPGLSRFRANVFQQRNSMGAVFRCIPLSIPSLDDLKLPKVCRFLAERPRGLVLVTGPTGSGKSTTLAAMIDHINATRPVHIVTLEDPIEFMHRNKKAYVNQREIGTDTRSFASALRRVLRQDPDVILVGEMRDLETISAAITAAETGHLVLATLHTTGGPETVDRIIDVFPPHQQQQIRMQLSATLEGVLSQVLLQSADGVSRTMAMEIMLGVPAISNLIREGKTHQMPTIIHGAQSVGMQTLDQDIKRLLTAGLVTFDEAISKAKEPRELAAMVGRPIQG